MAESAIKAGEGASVLPRALGFSAQEQAALLALRRRHQRGEFGEITVEHKRLEFARWLVRRGRLNEGEGGDR